MLYHAPAAEKSASVTVTAQPAGNITAIPNIRLPVSVKVLKGSFQTVAAYKVNSK